MVAGNNAAVSSNATNPNDHFTHGRDKPSRTLSRSRNTFRLPEDLQAFKLEGTCMAVRMRGFRAFDRNSDWTNKANLGSLLLSTTLIVRLLMYAKYRTTEEKINCNSSIATSQGETTLCLLLPLSLLALLHTRVVARRLYQLSTMVLCTARLVSQSFFCSSIFLLSLKSPSI